MLRKLTERMHTEEKGFTLIELLVVMLIIGILAAIALPVFLGQQKKGQDADAKSNARNLVSQVESCYADKQNFTLCDASDEVGTTGLSMVAPATEPGNAQVGVTASAANTYTIQGKSKSGNFFAIVKASDGTITRDCGDPYQATGTYAAGDNDGGCPSGGSW